MKRFFNLFYQTHIVIGENETKRVTQIRAWILFLIIFLCIQEASQTTSIPLRYLFCFLATEYLFRLSQRLWGKIKHTQA